MTEPTLRPQRGEQGMFLQRRVGARQHFRISNGVRARASSGVWGMFGKDCIYTKTKS